MADFSVFYVQFPYALFSTLEKHFYDFFIVYHHTASFPASPIYYGLSGEYCIKSQTFSKNSCRTLPLGMPCRCRVSCCS